MAVNMRRRLSSNQPGKADPVSYTCTCSQPGSVLLFYRYFANEPRLPQELMHLAVAPEKQADFHREVCTANGLTGKIRVSEEGFNCTVAGSREGIRAYIAACCRNIFFRGLDLNGNKEKQNAFFKPTPGCKCVFTHLNVRVTCEITPLGVTSYSPSTWSAVRSLSPAEFHQKCLEEAVKLIDVRNHYESKIGYFVSPKGGETIKPPIRRFSQWPQWVREHVSEIQDDGFDEGIEGTQKPLLTYCTGGIRCEKGVRWMEEHLSTITASQRPTFTLDGGIAAYLTWMEAEVAAGRKRPDESLFKGSNYVFDARGSTAIEGSIPVSVCHGCGSKTARLTKCATEGCHLVLVACEDCESRDIRCCQSCKQLSESEVADKNGAKMLCECEQAREKALWGEQRVKQAKTQGWKTRRKMAHTDISRESMRKENINMTTFSQLSLT